jgi:hypothetical protein
LCCCLTMTVSVVVKFGTFQNAHNSHITQQYHSTIMISMKQPTNTMYSMFTATHDFRGKHDLTTVNYRQTFIQNTLVFIYFYYRSRRRKCDVCLSCYIESLMDRVVIVLTRGESSRSPSFRLKPKPKPLYAPHCFIKTYDRSSN